MGTVFIVCSMLLCVVSGLKLVIWRRQGNPWKALWDLVVEKELWFWCITHNHITGRGWMRVNGAIFSFVPAATVLMQEIVKRYEKVFNWSVTKFNCFSHDYCGSEILSILQWLSGLTDFVKSNKHIFGCYV